MGSTYLEGRASDRQIQSEIREYFETLIQSKQWLEKKANSRTASLLARHYITCAQLKKRNGSVFYRQR